MITNLNSTQDWSSIAEWLDWWIEKPRLAHSEQKTLDKYYSSYKNSFGDYLKRQYANQAEEICRLIRGMNNPKVLEVGCGCGTESLWFAILGAEVLGIDLQESRLEVARSRRNYLSKEKGINLPANFCFSSFFDLNERGQFDIIWMEQAFHHIEPRDMVPRQAMNLLKPGGYLVISEANGLNPFLQLLLLRKRGFRTVEKYTDAYGRVHAYGNERITSMSNLCGLFEKNGFELVLSRYFRALPNIKGIEDFTWLENMVPSWLTPAFTHFNVVFQRTH